MAHLRVVRLNSTTGHDEAAEPEPDPQQQFQHIKISKLTADHFLYLSTDISRPATACFCALAHWQLQTWSRPDMHGNSDYTLIHK